MFAISISYDCLLTEMILQSMKALLTCSFRRKSPTAFLPTELILVLSSFRRTSGLPSSPVFLLMVTSPCPASNMTRRIQNRACMCACRQAPVSGEKNSRDSSPARAMFNQFTYIISSAESSMWPNILKVENHSVIFVTDKYTVKHYLFARTLFFLLTGKSIEMWK